MSNKRNYTPRMILLWTGLAVVACLVVWAVGSYAIRWSVAEPGYEVLESRSGYEIRRYEPYAVAEVSVEGTYGTALSEGFRVLFSYISGANIRQPVQITTIRDETEVASDTIAMTAPVLYDEADRGEQIVSFVLPPGMVASAAPRPEDPRIRLNDVPERIVAVRTFHGRGTEGAFARERERLSTALQADGSLILSSFRFAQYDPPGSFWPLRRNEVHVTVKP